VVLSCEAQIVRRFPEVPLMQEPSCPFEPVGLPIHDSVVQDWRSHTLKPLYGTVKKSGRLWIDMACGECDWTHGRVYLDGPAEKDLEKLDKLAIDCVAHSLETLTSVGSMRAA
jgi:hypothetical protein